MSHHSGPADSGVVEVDGAALAYERAGQGPPVVLLHAGIADRRMWDAQIPALVAQHTVVRYDLRGFGASPMPDLPFAHHDDLAELLAALDIEQASLVGCSFGGRVAIDTAIAHPARVERLALINPALSGFPWPEELNAGEEEIEAAFLAGDFDRAAEVDLRTWVDGPQRRPEDVDPAVRERAREMARHVYAVAVDLSGVAHLANLEAPDAVNRLLLDFLDGGETDGQG